LVAYTRERVTYLCNEGIHRWTIGRVHTEEKDTYIGRVRTYGMKASISRVPLEEGHVPLEEGIHRWTIGRVQTGDRDGDRYHDLDGVGIRRGNVGVRCM